MTSPLIFSGETVGLPGVQFPTGATVSTVGASPGDGTASTDTGSTLLNTINTIVNTASKAYGAYSQTQLVDKALSTGVSLNIPGGPQVGFAAQPSLSNFGTALGLSSGTVLLIVVVLVLVLLLRR
jgi:hypothetical protein